MSIAKYHIYLTGDVLYEDLIFNRWDADAWRRYSLDWTGSWVHHMAAKQFYD